MKFTDEQNELLAFLPNELKKTKELTDSAKLVLGDLIFLSGMEEAKKNGYVFRSYEDLIKDTFISSMTSISRAISLLVEKEYIKVKKGTLKGRKANEFTLLNGTVSNKKCSEKCSDKCSENSTLIERVQMLENKIAMLENKLEKIEKCSDKCSGMCSEKCSTDSDTDIDTDITTANTVPEYIEKEKINKNINISTGLKKEKDETSNVPVEDNNFNFIDWDEFDDVPFNEVPNKNNNNLNNFESMEKTNMVPLKTDEKQSETGLTSLATALDKKEIIKEKAAAPLAAAAKSQETQNKAHSGVKNDAVEQLPTNDEKTQHEARKYVETLTQRIYHEKNVENFKKLHDEYVAEMKNYKARYGTDNFVIKQKNWYRATRSYFPKKKIDSNINCYFTFYKENFMDVKTANQLKQALDKLCGFMEKIENEGYDVEKLRPDYNRFISSKKREFEDIWDTWN